jgi:putative SOS response-associated peptidase YedK
MAAQLSDAEMTEVVSTGVLNSSADKKERSIRSICAESVRPQGNYTTGRCFDSTWVSAHRLPKNDRQPHYFTRADGQPMALAGLWDRWKSKDKSETKETFTIVTTEPSKFAAQFHNRMPFVLEPDRWDLWMKGEPETAAALMKPANEDVLVSRPVSKAVGNVKNNGPELLS